MNLIWIAQIVLLVVFASVILYTVRGSRRVRPVREIARVAPRAAPSTSGSETLLQSLSAGRRQPQAPQSRQPPRI